jgi:DNA repair protein RadC
MEKYEANLFAPQEPEIVCEKSVEYTITAKTNEFDKFSIRSPEDSEAFARRFYHDDICVYESAFIILLNNSMKTIGWAKIAQGGLTATIVDVRLVAKFALDVLATSVIFVHNHPSGNLTPSIQDDALTQKLKEGLALLDISLRDSLIIAPVEGYYSYNEVGKL